MPPARVLDLIRAFFPDFLRLVEDEADRFLDFETVSFPLEERGLSPEARSELGLAAEIHDLAGEKITILVQVVPEALLEAEIARWVRRLAQILFLRLGDPFLVIFVMLGKGLPGLNVDSAVVARVFQLVAARIHYTTFSLGGSRAEYYLERPEPLACALASSMLSRVGRAEHKWACVERIQKASLAEEHRELLLGFIEACLCLTPEEEESFTRISTLP